MDSAFIHQAANELVQNVGTRNIKQIARSCSLDISETSRIRDMLGLLSLYFDLLLLLDFFQVSAQCILPSRKRSKACLHQLALIQTTIERTSSFAQTILRRGHWQDFRLPSSLTVDFFVKSYQLM